MKQYNESKICFIICADNDVFLQECLLYIGLLEVPGGYEVDVLTLDNVESVAAGYNEAMNYSDAKYKVYLHQNTLIIEKNFIGLFLNIFKKNPQIGMLGVLGAERFSKDGILAHSILCGEGKNKGEILEADALDGSLLVTQYDIPWRDDVFTDKYFYDTAQGFEFKRVGYKLVVPIQGKDWIKRIEKKTIDPKLELEREKLLCEYPEIINNADYLRILFLHSKNIQILGIPYSLIEMGHVVDIPQYEVHIDCYDKKDVEEIEDILQDGHYDLVITYDFSFGVSEACENMKVKYFAWVYDSPLLQLYSEYAKNSYTHVSVFDKKQFQLMKEYGLPNLYHVPLCAEVEAFGSASVTKKDEKKYATDVAFVGRLYDHRGYNGLFGTDDERLKAEFDTAVNKCGCKWDGTQSVYNIISDELVEHICRNLTEDVWQTFQVSKRFYCESMKIAGRCNEVERVAILNKLAERYKVTLYSDDSPKDMLRNVRIKPWVDYWTEMPKVFHLSKINLNITSRSIETGIPQRIWDIMAVGGFCLTNYQEEIEDHFVVGRDLEVYHDMDELMDKVGYYLKHEDKRIRIAMNGYKLVREKHQYRMRLEGLLYNIGLFS